MNTPFPKSQAAFSDVKYSYVQGDPMIVAIVNPVNPQVLAFCVSRCMSSTHLKIQGHLPNTQLISELLASLGFWCYVVLLLAHLKGKFVPKEILAG